MAAVGSFPAFVMRWTVRADTPRITHASSTVTRSFPEGPCISGSFSGFGSIDRCTSPQLPRTLPIRLLSEQGPPAEARCSNSRRTCATSGGSAHRSSAAASAWQASPAFGEVEEPPAGSIEPDAGHPEGGTLHPPEQVADPDAEPEEPGDLARGKPGLGGGDRGRHGQHPAR